MPATLAAQRVTVSVETLLDIIVGLISQAVGESNTDRLRLRIAIGASEASLIGKHALQTRRSRSWRRFSMQWTKPPSASISMMIPSITRLPANWRLEPRDGLVLRRLSPAYGRLALRSTTRSRSLVRAAARYSER